MHSEIEALGEMLDQAEALLRSYGQVRWAEWLAKDARLIRSLDGFGIEHLLSAYGGIGSLNDVVLQRSNSGTEVLIPEGDNDHFDELRGEIYALARKLGSLEYKPESRITDKASPLQMDFTFHTRWKEELVCSSPLGELILEMPMGIPSVYLPTEASWQNSAPEWARPYWSALHAQLKAWCARHEFPLYVDSTASVFVQ